MYIIERHRWESLPGLIVSVSPTLTPVGEIGFVYPAAYDYSDNSLRKPNAYSKSGGYLVMFDVA
jgi:hypothetical protein